MFPRSYLLNLMPENYFTERETVAGGSITFTTPLPYASAQLTRFVIDERLLIASNKAMAWVAVTAVTEHDDHMEYEADVLSGRPGTFDPRTTIISYGLPGEGYIIHQTNEGRSYVDVSRHEGRPWKEEDITNILRMGWLGGVGLEAPTTNWLGPMSTSGALLNPSLDFESTEYGLAIGPNFAGGPWSVFSDIRHHSYRSSHNWATVNKETGGVDADASGEELAWWIGEKSDPCLWLTAEGVCGTTLLGGGDDGDDGDDGGTTSAFLLGPNTPRTSTQWKSAQGHVAELSGAFRLGQGPFPATQSLTVLEDDDNLVENPVFENNVTDYWTGISNGTAAHVSTNPRWGTKCCKLATTGSSGLVFRKVAAIASPSQYDLVTWSIFVRGAGDTLGKDVWLFVSEKGAANAFQSGDVVTMTSEWQRVAVTHEVSQSGVTGLNIKVLGPAGSAGDYFFVDGANLTETDYLVPHIDGEREGCSWSGTAHNSVSGVTAATVVDLDDDVDVINSHPQLSIGMWVRMPCDSDSGSAELLLMDAFSAAAAMDRFMIYFKCAGAGHYWGVYCQGGERLTTSTSECLSSGGFNAGEQVFVVLTLDFDEGDGHFYMNGASYGTFAGALQRFAFTIWRLGGNFNGREQRGLGIGEVSVYHRILSPTEVAEFSRQQQPMSSGTQDVQEGVTYGGGLVNVPRGTVYGGQDACANIISPGANYNTVIGHGAMYYNETGDYNSIFGYYAGRGVSTKSFEGNCLFGAEAGRNLTADGDDNSIFGTWAGLKLTTGYRNVFIGYVAGWGVTSGTNSVFIGDYAGYAANFNDTTGYLDCVGIGSYTMYSLESGRSNVAVGTSALTDVTNGNWNVAVGDSAMLDLTEGEYNIGVGAHSIFSITTGSGNIGIGRFTAGNLVTKDGNIFIGHHAGYTAGEVEGTVAIGYEAAYDMTDVSFGSYNTLVGYQAGRSLTTGGDNVLMGYQAGYLLTGSASENVVIGRGAADDATSMSTCVVIGAVAGSQLLYEYDCTFVGYGAGAQAGSETGTAVENTYIGAYAGNYNDGYENTCLGTYAGRGDLSTANYNYCVIVGTGAGITLTTGSNNALIGYQAGSALTTGGNNVFMGYQAGLGATTGNNSVFIGHEAAFVNGGFCNVVIGETAGHDLTATSQENVIIGDATAYRATELAYCVIIGQTAGYRLKDETGCVFVGASAGAYAGSWTGSAICNIYIGQEAGTYNDGYHNIIMGYEAGEGDLTNSSFNYSVLIGNYAGSCLETGHNNVLIGYEAGKAITTGGDNVLMGYQAGAAITDSDENVFIGYYCGEAATEAIATVCVGAYAGQNLAAGSSADTFIGYASGRDNASGTANTYLGHEAGRENEGGSENVYVGYGCGEGVTGNDQNQNAILGALALTAATTASYNAGVGYQTLNGSQTATYNATLGYRASYRGDGDYNVCVGALAGNGVSLNDHSNNVFVGYKAGFAITTGSSNIFLGYQAGSTETTGSNKLYIENSASTTPLIYGEFDNDILKIYGTLIVNEGGLAGYDVRFESDSNDKMFWLDASADTLQIGDPTGGNYSQFASDGLYTMTGTARVTVDLYIDAAGLKAPGAKPATYIQHGLAGAWQFADEAVAGNQQTISGKLPLPSQMDRTVVPVFKVGWSANGVSPGNCEWQLEYRYMSPNDDTTATAQETLTVIGTASSTTDGLTITAFSGIDLPSSTDAAMFFQITRLSAGTNDTISDTAELHGMIFSHTIDKLGTAT